MVLEPKKPKRRKSPNIGFYLQRVFTNKYGMHPDMVTMSNYINKSLNESEMKRIEQHLMVCKQCRKEIESTKEAIRRFESDELEDVPKHIAAGVVSHIKNLKNKK